MYGEQILSEDGKQTGASYTVDARRQGDKYVGTQRLRVPLKVNDSSLGFHYNTCQFETPIDLTFVTEERIDGRQTIPKQCEIGRVHVRMVGRTELGRNKLDSRINAILDLFTIID